MSPVKQCNCSCLDSRKKGSAYSNFDHKQSMAPKSKGSPCLPLLALLCLMSTLVVSATTSSCVEPSIVKAEKEMWKAERLLRKDGQPTRWMAEEGGFFVMHLGCQKIVKGFRIDNSQHKNKEGNKKGSFAFEILSQLSVFIFIGPKSDH